MVKEHYTFDFWLPDGEGQYPYLTKEASYVAIENAIAWTGERLGFFSKLDGAGSEDDPSRAVIRGAGMLAISTADKQQLTRDAFADVQYRSDSEVRDNDQLCSVLTEHLIARSIKGMTSRISNGDAYLFSRLEQPSRTEQHVTRLDRAAGKLPLTGGVLFWALEIYRYRNGLDAPPIGVIGMFGTFASVGTTRAIYRRTRPMGTLLSSRNAQLATQQLAKEVWSDPNNPWQHIFT